MTWKKHNKSEEIKHRGHVDFEMEIWKRESVVESIGNTIHC